MKTNSSSPWSEITLIEVLGLAVVALCLIGFAARHWAREVSQRNICLNQLDRMWEAKKVWCKQNQDSTNICTMRDLMGASRHFSQVPFCPAEGVYVIGPRGVKPTCSWHTTRAALNRAAP